MDEPNVNTEWAAENIKLKSISKKKAQRERAWYLSFIWAAISGTTAICYAQPLSLLKTRMHINVKDPIRNTVTGEFSYILATRGILGLYQGLTANLTRQLIYTSSRVGLFYTIIDYVKSENIVKKINFSDRFIIGLFSGAIASLISVPMEVAFVRMAADERLPVQERRLYKNVGDALLRILRNEGVKSLWVGTGPSLVKGMLQNAISLGFYTEIKSKIHDSKYFGNDEGDWRVTASAALISGIISSIFLSPLDLIKVRVQTAPFKKRTKNCSNMFNTTLKILRTEGLKPFYHGIIPTTLYLLPFTSSLFLCFEQTKKLGLNPCPEDTSYRR